MSITLLLISAVFWLSCDLKENTENDLGMVKDSIQVQINKTWKYLALGDSYTIGEGVAEYQSFPAQLVKMLNDNGIKTKPAAIIARTGWTTDNLTQGIKISGQTETYDLVTLLIGVNNQYQGKDTAEYRMQFRSLLQTAIKLAGNSERKVIVISNPDYGVTPFAMFGDTMKIASEIDMYNAINLEETKIRNSYYVNITPISRKAKRDASLVASDGLHPSEKMYRLWVESIYPVAKLIFKNQ